MFMLKPLSNKLLDFNEMIPSKVLTEIKNSNLKRVKKKVMD